MTNLIRKIGLLSWKNMKVLQRHWLMTIFEILIPLSLFSLIAWLNTNAQGTEKFIVESPTYFKVHSREDINLVFPREAIHLYYMPSNNFTDKIMQDVQTKLSFSKTRLMRISSESELERMFAKSFENITIFSLNVIGVVFDVENQMPIPTNLKYKIRSASVEWSTDLIFPIHQGSGPMDSSELYFRTGFLALQNEIDLSFINLVKPKNSSLVDVTVQAFPYPPYIADSGYTIISGSMVGNCIVFGFVVLCLNVLGRIVEDKQTGVTELMKLMGLSRQMLWLTWFLRFMIVNVLIITAIVFLLKYTFNEASGCVFSASSAGVLWFFLLLLSIAVSLFIFSISTLFSRPVFAMCFGAIIWLVSYFIPTTLIDSYKPKSLAVKLISSLLPNVAMYWGFSIVETFEARQVGVLWSNLLKSPSGIPNDICMYQVLGMLVVDIFLYGFLTWYLDSILPGSYGVPERWYFCFTESYWRNGKVDTVYDGGMYGSGEGVGHNNFESAPLGLKVGIKIQDLHKVYESGKVAVDGVSLDIYEDQITVLLGHNGAGKTTTMSVLTGMLPSSSGSVWINDYNIRTHMHKVRESLGLCPQHNMLFADLTVMEHLVFFGMLKGCSYEVAMKGAAELLSSMHLTEKSNAMASELSGGMKRKLSLGIALIGDSRVVILDEPTSGIDPEARRQIWDLLLSMRGHRTIVITTHFMEEADVLGDRIAIMDHGRVQCYGTSLFLKKQYGAGYVLKLLTRNSTNDLKITEIVQQAVRGGKLKSRLGSELSFTLPSEQKSHFPSLFDSMERDKLELGVSSIGVSLTTLEDVFLTVGTRVAEGGAMTGSLDDEVDSESSLQNDRGPRVKGLALMFQQIQALFIKKIIFTQRKWILFIVLAMVPLLLAIATVELSILILNGNDSDKTSRSILLSEYGSSEVLFTDSQNEIVRRYKKLVLDTGSTVQAIPPKVGVLNALLDIGEVDMGKYREGVVVSAEFNDTASNLLVNALYSGFAYHSASISLNLVNNALLKNYMNSDDYSINVVNRPLDTKEDYRTVKKAGVVLIWQQLIPLGLLFVMGNFLMFPIIERVSNAKQLQLMTGVSPLSYWMSCFVWDLMIYLVVAIGMVALVAICDTQQYFGSSKEMGVFMLILFLYGVSGIPYAYWFSYFKRTTPSGFGIFVVINFVIGSIMPWVISITELVLQDSEKWYSFVNNGKRILYLLPHFSLSYGLMHFCEQAVTNNECLAMTSDAKKHICLASPSDSCCSGTFETLPYLVLDSKNNPLGIGWPLIFLGLDSLLFFLLILLLDYGVLSRIYERLKRLKWLARSDEDTVDGDVLVEMNRVKEVSNANVLTVNDMMKVYGHKALAVQGVSFGVLPGECFGLLGVNGAGKTTTFKMLTGDELPTRGEARIADWSLSNNKGTYLSQIGYCPQFDAFNESLTGREMLELFARLRGICKEDVQQDASKWLKQMGLLEYQDSLCGTYSGGNKRKLSTAMALIGDPPLIFLDEPTSGVDPVARRNLWSVLAKIQKTDHSIVLTSHSMEECEALCNRLAIMVKGQFVCIGETQYLKQKFGQGFTVMIKLNNVGSNEHRVSDVKHEFIGTFSDCVLKDEHQGLLHYHLTNPRLTWKTLFSNMEALKGRCDAIEDYTISETTLEQVFLSFAQKSSR